MTYFEDLSDYSYRAEYVRPGTKNIGWLAVGHDFERSDPSKELLDKLWALCKISVVPMRGIHKCEFCADGGFFAERDGETLLLGTSEIRVFGKGQRIFAAPNLVFHYIDAHHYRPPDEFLLSVVESPEPGSDAHLARLNELKLDWRLTSSPADRPKESRAERDATGRVIRNEIH